MRKLICLALCAILAPALAAAQAFQFKPYKPAYMAYQSKDGQQTIRYRYSTQVPLTRETIPLPFLPDGAPTLAYTQTSTIEPDSSFRFMLTNYNPEIFYRIPFSYRWLGDVTVGYEHLSSGEDGALSNGIDLLAAQINVPLFTASPLGSDSISVTAWVRPRYIIGTEPNTAGLRERVSLWGNDFFPEAGIIVETGGGRYEARFTRDSIDTEAMLKLASLWNFNVFGSFHGGSAQDIAAWQDSAKAWAVGAGFVW